MDENFCQSVPWDPACNVSELPNETDGSSDSSSAMLHHYISMYYDPSLYLQVSCSIIISPGIRLHHYISRYYAPSLYLHVLCSIIISPCIMLHHYISRYYAPSLCLHVLCSIIIYPDIMRHLRRADHLDNLVSVSVT